MRTQIADHVCAVESLIAHVPLLERIADRIIDCFDRGGRLYLLGNGGSAADAQHIAAELVGRFKADRKPLPAVALTTDTSNLTAIGNDLGFDRVFARQVEALVTGVDVVWALSVSGRSPNVLAACEAARHGGACIIGFSGRNGDPLEALTDLCFRADHDQSDRVQEVHLLAYHLVCERIERHYLAG
ncbi:MAG: SIS domain-containing protein [Planctomycetota bacterium]